MNAPDGIFSRTSGNRPGVKLGFAYKRLRAAHSQGYPYATQFTARRSPFITAQHGVAPAPMNHIASATSGADVVFRELRRYRGPVVDRVPDHQERHFARGQQTHTEQTSLIISGDAGTDTSDRLLVLAASFLQYSDTASAFHG